MASKVEIAASKMRELAASDLTKKLKTANEAETRLLLIDRVLEGSWIMARSVRS